MAFFLLLGPSGAGCALQCTVGEAGLHCASQLDREVIFDPPPPSSSAFSSAQSTVQDCPTRMQPPDLPYSISFIFLFRLGPGDRWGAEAEQVSGGDRSNRGSG